MLGASGGCPYNESLSILGSILGPPDCWKLPNSGSIFLVELQYDTPQTHLKMILDCAEDMELRLAAIPLQKADPRAASGAFTVALCS